MSRLRSRLAVRIYLAGLAQFAAVVLGFTLLFWMTRARDHRAEREARAAIEAILGKLSDREELSRALDALDRERGATVTIYDQAGQIVATNRRAGDEPEPPLPFPLPPSSGEPFFGPPPRWLPWPGPPRIMRSEGSEPAGPPHDRLFSRFAGPPPHGPPPDGPGPMMPAYVISVRLPDGTTGTAVHVSRVRVAPPSTWTIAALVLVVVGVTSVLTARSLTRPLSKLSHSARRLGEGDLEARTGLRRADEIGDVAAAFDEMADRITQLVRAEKELLANVSHELRTPLARIRVALDLAAEGDAEVARQSLSEIAEDLAELEQLIADVLAAARLDLANGTHRAGAPPIRREQVDVADLVERAASRFRSAHPARALTISLAADLEALEGDPVLLRRAIDNVLENAHKYTARAEGQVELRATREVGSIVLEIRDHGVGISEEDLPDVFRPFFRADKSRTRATGGLGLGLALVKRIVEAHDGQVEVESQVGRGTNVRIRLPSANG